MCNQSGLNKELRCEIVKPCKMLKQSYSYFQYRDLQYIQKGGLGMGAPTSSIFSEIYLKYLENTKTFNISVKRHLIGLLRYIDEILIVYQNNRTNIH
jgi:hypothetical protein